MRLRYFESQFLDKMFSYVVSCKFTDPDVADRWVNWLAAKHIQEVLDAGAVAGEIFKMDDELRYEIRYLFESKEAFQVYETEHAPRLREDGLKTFPLDLGLEYSRSCSESIGRFS